MSACVCVRACVRVCEPRAGQVVVFRTFSEPRDYVRLMGHENGTLNDGRPPQHATVSLRCVPPLTASVSNIRTSNLILTGRQTVLTS